MDRRLSTVQVVVEPAQEAISTDRPGFLFSPSLVPPGRLQVEAGLPLAFLDDEDGVESELYSLPVQLRYGLGPELELRLGGPLYNWLRVDDASDEQGFGDLEVGLGLGVGGHRATAAIHKDRACCERTLGMTGVPFFVSR